MMNELDCVGIKCPIPIVMMAQRMNKIDLSETLQVRCDDPAFLPDVVAWTKRTGHELVDAQDGQIKQVTVRKTISLVEESNASAVFSTEENSIRRMVDARVNEILKQRLPQNKLTIVCLSEDMDKLMASFIIMAGAVASGMTVSIFFTFGGLEALKKKSHMVSQSEVENIVIAMLTSRKAIAATAKIPKAGKHTKILHNAMKNSHETSLSELFEIAREFDVRLIACEMSMDVMGLAREDLIDGIEYAGVAEYINDASDSRISLFI